MSPLRTLALAGTALCAMVPAARAANSISVTQYGISWTFDKPYPVGQFITGDWWVVGPVTIISVSPVPSTAPATEPATDAKSRYGAVSLIDDKRMRNGSMIVLGPQNTVSFSKQGYDSRAKNFDPALSIKYPCNLPAGQSLVSTISSEAYKDGKLATPYIPASLFPEELKGLADNPATLALDTAAILTCLDQAPPADAFRPAYCGPDRTLYRAASIHWDLLPNLKAPGPIPDWDKMARVYQRPWLDHIADWTIQFLAPGENQGAYGGVMTMMNSFASVLLLTDAPREQKQKLLIPFLQYGIDLHGLAASGREWFSDGGHWMGRKWPILFASLMLDQPALREFPKVKTDGTNFGEHNFLEPGVTPTTLFSEDMDTYYGKGANGADVLWQCCFHTHPRRPFLELPYAEWNDDDKFTNNYFWVGGQWPGFALAALYLKAKGAWDHDAFFDYCDWFMSPSGTKIDSKDGHTGPTRVLTQKFIQSMWDAYRAGAPAQPGGTTNVKWVWTDGKVSEGNAEPTTDGKAAAASKGFTAKKGKFVPNPKGATE